jgi:PleD family two-component response regulator
MNTAMLQGTAFEEDYAPLKAVLVQGTTLVVEDVSQGDHFLKEDVLDQAGLSCVMSMACVPFMVEKEVLGVAVYFAEADKIKRIRWDHPRWSALVQQVSVALGSAVQNELAVHDRLTRLHNHGFFHEALSEAMKEARGFLASGTRQGCLSLIMLDVDHFKQFNDTYGHQTGDRVLKQIAGILRRQCNPNYEIAARYGGEEFAVILKMMPLASSVLPDQEVSGEDLAALGGAVGKAEMIRRRIEEAQFMEGDKSLKVTVSLGVGCWRYPQDENNPKESFIKIVDDELYRAKKSGRNRVCYRSG